MYHFPAVEVFQCKGNLIDYELLVYLLQDILPDNVVKIRLHILKDQVDVLVVFSTVHLH